MSSTHPTLPSSSASASRHDSASGGGSSAWILSSWYDLLMFIATPLLIVPLVLGARQWYSVEEIYLFVVAFGATGHHLPGMLRAYGDRELFRRFRLRFILAPIFLLAVCVGFAWQNLEGLIVVLLMWGFWHGMMQVYGFIRIYDAKAKSFSRYTARLDWLMCLSWFGMGLLWSPGRMEQIFREMYKAGLPLIEPTHFQIVQWGWLSLTVLISALFTANYISQRATGAAPNPLKLMTMGVSFAFWWFCMVNIKHTLLGIALFEIFHDVQYLAIVWVFNRKRAETDPQVGAFTKFVFRRNGAMVAVYLTMVLAYGFVVGMLPSMVIPREVFVTSIYGVLAASTFLHFYFDGFIWKVREQGTRKSLGLATAGARQELGFTFAREGVHALKWAAFVIPVGFLGFSEMRSEGLKLESFQNVAMLTPGSWRAWHAYGTALMNEGDYAAAIEPLTNAVELNEDNAIGFADLGFAYRMTGQFDEAQEAFETALLQDESLTIAHNELGKLLYAEAVDAHRVAAELRSPQRGEAAQEAFTKAFTHLERAVELAPEDAAAQLTLADACRQYATMSGPSVDNQQVDIDQLKKSLELYDALLGLAPDMVQAYEGRGATWQQLGEVERALEDFSRAIELLPEKAHLYLNRGRLYRSLQDFPRAIQDFQKATEFPMSAMYAHRELAVTLAQGPPEIRDFTQAEQHALALNRLAGSRDPRGWQLVANIRLAAGKAPEALEALQQALQWADGSLRPQLMQQIEALKKQME